jgi:hypothetical protein
MPTELFKVGVARFELTASSTPCWRATGLRYTPKKIIFNQNLNKVFQLIYNLNFAKVKLISVLI